MKNIFSIIGILTILISSVASVPLAEAQSAYGPGLSYGYRSGRPIYNDFSWPYSASVPYYSGSQSARYYGSFGPHSYTYRYDDRYRRGRRSSFTSPSVWGRYSPRSGFIGSGRYGYGNSYLSGRRGIIRSTGYGTARRFSY